MPQFRFTVRRMMIVVAICAAILGVLCERRARFLTIAARHEELNRPWLLYPGFFTPQQVMWSFALQEKYEYAARHPWLPIASDPPEPNREAMLPNSTKGSLPPIPEDESPFAPLPAAPGPPPPK